MLKNNSNLLFLKACVLMMFLFGQCTKKEDPKPIPIASFSFSGENQTAPAIVSFSNSSQHASSFVWEFGDGQSSTEQNPKHTYTKGGTFTIKLTAIGEGGSNKSEKTITISSIFISAGFYISGDNQTVPAKVNFFNSSYNSESYKWEFGDGGTSTEKEPSYTYTKAGTFTVKLTVTAKDGSTDIKTATVTVKEKEQIALPVADFSIIGANNYAPSTVSFSNSSKNAVSYIWNFGDGSTSTLYVPSHLYTKGGTYNVTLTAKNSEGKESIISKTVVVKNAPTKLKINKVNVLKLPFTDDKGKSWDFTDGPDLYFTVASTDGKTNFFKTFIAYDLTPDKIPGAFDEYDGLPYTLGSFDYQYTLLFYDYDIDGDDWIGGYYFTVRDNMPTNGNAYPSTITFGTSSDKIQLRLELEWLP